MGIPVVAQAAARIRAALPDVATYEGPATERAEGTGSAVVEVHDGGVWGRADLNARRRVLQINVLSDRTRDSDGLPTADNADYLAWDLFLDIDPLFNDAAQDWRRNGWHAVHSSRRSDGPSLTTIPDSDGGVLLTVRYEVSHD